MALFKNLTEEQKERAIRKGYVGLFAERDTIQEAYNYALEMANQSEDTPWITTAICVLVNTYAIQLTIDEESQIDLDDYNLQDLWREIKAVDIQTLPPTIRKLIEEVYSKTSIPKIMDINQSEIDSYSQEQKTICNLPSGSEERVRLARLFRDKYGLNDIEWKFLCGD